MFAALLAAALLTVSTPTVADEVATTARERQWQLGTLRMAEAWRLTRGAGVTVAVLDTGVDARHPDLRGAVVKGPDLTGQNPGGDRWGHHGTAMASLIAGRGHGKNRAGGVIGIAPESTVLSVRVTLENDDPRRELQRTRSRGHDSLARGIRYAVDHGAQVISMSLGGGSGTWEGSAAEEEAVQYALARGAVLVASAGNDGEGPNRKNFPAAYPGVIAVGAVDRKLKVAAFSNRQTYLSVVAPGKQIVSADGPRSYVIGDGTSSAAAMVAGIAALVRSAYPRLTPLQVRRAIESGADREGHSKAYGHGVVNAAHALAEARRLAERAPVTAPEGLPYFGGGPSGTGTGTGTRLLVIAALLVLAVAMAARLVALSRRERR
ncbi:type VII secretion-associated serine protease mycosin [Nonomuraea sp. NPDC049152]|uniref:type VII secretion-associated serine protease mycosin n=1 Tax=Nonomuraea sp. NPDC049152 TaxID=3154350 RepID=UPI00340CE132